MTDPSGTRRSTPLPRGDPAWCRAARLHASRPTALSLPFDASDGMITSATPGPCAARMETLRALLLAVVKLRDEQPALFAPTPTPLIGTSNQSVRPTRFASCRSRGVGARRRRARAADAAAVLAIVVAAAGQCAAGVVAANRTITAARSFRSCWPAAVLAVYHEQSSVTGVVASLGHAPSVALVTYSDKAAPRHGWTPSTRVCDGRSPRR